MDKVDIYRALSTKLGVLVDTEVKTEGLSTKSGDFVDGDIKRDIGYLAGRLFMVSNFY